MIVNRVTIENLIEQARDIIRYNGTVHCDTPIYEKFHKEVTEYVYANSFDNTEDWKLILKNLICRSREYLSRQEADYILVGLENLRLKVLARKYRYKELEYIHPEILKVCQKLYEDKHYHKAVLAAYIEIEVRLKAIYKKLKPQEKELIGANLMMAIFSDNEPTLLQFQSRENAEGHDVQKGFMQIFAGAMTGIRNLPAHGNEDIPKDDAVRKLMLASLLMYKVDEAIAFTGINE